MSQKTAFFIVTAVNTSNLYRQNRFSSSRGRLMRHEVEYSSSFTAEVRRGGIIRPLYDTVGYSISHKPIRFLGLLWE
jgi:hypothetical protein